MFVLTVPNMQHKSSFPIGPVAVERVNMRTVQQRTVYVPSNVVTTKAMPLWSSSVVVNGRYPPSWDAMFEKGVG